MNIGSIYTRWLTRPTAAQLLHVLVLVTSLWTSADAQDAEELAKQQMEVMKQYMEASGMSAEDIAKNEAMLRDSMGPIVEAQAAQEAREQAEFEARTADLGKAIVSLPDKAIELQITECVSPGDGNYRVLAQANHDNRSDSLDLRGNGYYNRTELMMFLKGVGDYEIWIQPIAKLENGRFSWTGKAKNGYGETDVKVTVNCEAGS